ncbi:hypothetical protein GQ61_00025 [Candidatus Nucleicultrix amoebiphila FS5]|uniref:Uncharacterized protein n=1 Tax=Candidatus Nucleicultrix amoebiphila FS5 TaxID=1414854 RepID=A0A1W6N2A7_9PROT|nr:hypothetical protein GQ61_00025 [Candidatus Nucleicultrix amoebiphila FS5]
MLKKSLALVCVFSIYRISIFHGFLFDKRGSFCQVFKTFFAHEINFVNQINALAMKTKLQRGKK